MDKKTNNFRTLQNAIKRWQTDGDDTGNGVGGISKAKGNFELYHCSGCRKKSLHEKVPQKRTPRTLLFECVDCGRTVRKPDPAQKVYPMGMCLLEGIKKRGMKGMSLETYSMLVEAGVPPIDEAPFLREKGINLSR